VSIGCWSYNGATCPAPGYWALLSGKLKPGETQEEALIREVHETSGMRTNPVRASSPRIAVLALARATAEAVQPGGQRGDEQRIALAKIFVLRRSDATDMKQLQAQRDAVTAPPPV
jgi:ADP-ribose pyrophosphatase YjhB (NUDIX family)